jgi:Small protein A (tmRNA-binding)
MLSTVLLLNACAYVYQPDVQQGNYVTEDMLNNVELGMTKLQVEYYLGRPLIQDPFHNDRWDYFYSYRERQNKEREERNLVLFLMIMDC